jgi:hypothetical protein
MRRNADSYQCIQCGGVDLLILHLECNAPDHVLAWADDVIRRHADWPTIVTTHMFLGPLEEVLKGPLPPNTPTGIMRWSKCHGSAGNSPQQLWDKFLSRHANIFLLLCGDQSRCQTMRMTLTGAAGNRVDACLCDYREGYFRLYRFCPRAGRIDAITYSALTRQMCRRTAIAEEADAHQFSLPFPDIPMTANT